MSQNIQRKRPLLPKKSRKMSAESQQIQQKVRRIFAMGTVFARKAAS